MKPWSIKLSYIFTNLQRNGFDCEGSGDAIGVVLLDATGFEGVLDEAGLCDATGLRDIDGVLLPNSFPSPFILSLSKPS